MEQHIQYNGKHYTIPILSSESPHLFAPTPGDLQGRDISYDSNSPVMKDLNSIWDIGKFKTARAPVSFGTLQDYLQRPFSQVTNAPRVLDMPIKFPGSDYRLPDELSQFYHAIKEIADIEAEINPLVDQYYCYLTIDKGMVKQGTLEREAPCHVDGFQGARQQPTLINHTYTVTDCNPTAYYVQPFMVDMLDITKHDFFWEFNRQVAMTNSHYEIRHKPFEIVLMDAYCVHRGTEAEETRHRTWMRMSYETRVFDRLGNAHNPLFDYNWDMVERDIEQLHLVAYDPYCDPSLRVFPWQAIDGSRNPPGVKTKPRLKPLG